MSKWDLSVIDAFTILEEAKKVSGNNEKVVGVWSRWSRKITFFVLDELI